MSSFNDEVSTDDWSYGAHKAPVVSVSEQSILPHGSPPPFGGLRRRYMTGKNFEIGLALLLSTLPITRLMAALLCLVWTKKLLDNGNPRSFGGCPSGVYVNYSATRLTFLSSLVSTVATYMSFPIMTLISFPVARRLMKDSMSNSSAALPSPYQLHLLVSCLGAGISSLWKTLQYAVAWRSKRARLHSTMRIGFLLLFSVLTLSVSCQLADIWLHNKTTAVLFTSTQPSLSGAQAGRQLSEYCQEYYKHYQLTGGSIDGVFNTGFPDSRVPCNVYIHDVRSYINGSGQGYQLISGTSATNNVSRVSSSFDGTDREYALLTPSNIAPNKDWSADTVGVSAECALISKECRLGLPGFTSESVPYNCTGTSIPSPGGQPLSGTVYANSSLLLPDPDLFNLPKPYSFAYVASIAGNLGFADPNIITDVDQNIFMMCTTSVWDLSYNFTNNSITLTNAKLSNLNISQTVNAPAQIASDSVQPFVSSDLAIAIFGSESADQVMQEFAASYSHISMAFASSAFSAIPASSVFESTILIVTCVPIAPLVTLTALACIYVLFGVVLTIVALAVSGVDNVCSAHAQLNIIGLTAAAFEDAPSRLNEKTVTTAEELFKEYREGDSLGTQQDANVQRVGFSPHKTRHWEFQVKKSHDA